eukprot:PLAT11277.2.p1 GENE.PLAT11277.2~~PLAT11277.2.p1  ORF type:complete len:938 (+),score=369.09 PLAT11277.2:25-2838(+)
MRYRGLCCLSLLLLAAAAAAQNASDVAAGVNAWEGSVRVLDGRMTMEWSRAQDVMTFTLTAETTGWLGFGLGTGMTDGDFIIARSVRGQPEVHDYYSDSESAPLLDEELGANDDTQLVDWQQADGLTTVTFTRPLVATDPDYDRAVEAHSNVMLALHTSAALAKHSPDNRVSLLISFDGSPLPDGPSVTTTSGSSSTELGGRTEIVHGIAQIVLWGVFAPIGVFAIRHLKHKSWYLPFHATVMTVLMTASIPLATASVARVTSLRVSHGFLGAILVNLVALQFGLGRLVRYDMAQPRMRRRLSWTRRAHRFAGYFLVIYGLANCVLGLDLLVPGSIYYIGFIVYLSLLGVAFAVAELRAALSPTQKTKMKSLQVAVKGAVTSALRGGNRVRPLSAITTSTSSSVPPDESLPIVDYRALRELVFLGNKMVLFENYVVDISTLLDIHPGGAALVTPLLGKEVDDHIVGAASVMEQRHVHTPQVVHYLRCNRRCRFLPDDDVEAVLDARGSFLRVSLAAVDRPDDAAAMREERARRAEEEYKLSSGSEAGAAGAGSLSLPTEAAARREWVTSGRRSAAGSSLAALEDELDGVTASLPDGSKPESSVLSDAGAAVRTSGLPGRLATVRTHHRLVRFESSFMEPKSPMASYTSGASFGRGDSFDRGSGSAGSFGVMSPTARASRTDSAWSGRSSGAGSIEAALPAVRWRVLQVKAEPTAALLLHVELDDEHADKAALRQREGCFWLVLDSKRPIAAFRFLLPPAVHDRQMQVLVPRSHPAFSTLSALSEGDALQLRGPAHAALPVLYTDELTLVAQGSCSGMLLEVVDCLLTRDGMPVLSSVQVILCVRHKSDLIFADWLTDTSLLNPALKVHVFATTADGDWEGGTAGRLSASSLAALLTGPLYAFGSEPFTQQVSKWAEKAGLPRKSHCLIHCGEGSMST